MVSCSRRHRQMKLYNNAQRRSHNIPETNKRRAPNPKFFCRTKDDRKLQMHQYAKNRRCQRRIDFVLGSFSNRLVFISVPQWQLCIGIHFFIFLIITFGVRLTLLKIQSSFSNQKIKTQCLQILFIVFVKERLVDPATSPDTQSQFQKQPNNG